MTRSAGFNASDHQCAAGVIVKGALVERTLARAGYRLRVGYAEAIATAPGIPPSGLRAVVL
jgi:hypothetical protein